MKQFNNQNKSLFHIELHSINVIDSKGRNIYGGHYLAILEGLEF